MVSPFFAPLRLTSPRDRRNRFGVADAAGASVRIADAAGSGVGVADAPAAYVRAAGSRDDQRTQ